MTNELGGSLHLPSFFDKEKTMRTYAEYLDWVCSCETKTLVKTVENCVKDIHTDRLCHKESSIIIVEKSLALKTDEMIRSLGFYTLRSDKCLPGQYSDLIPENCLAIEVRFDFFQKFEDNLKTDIITKTANINNIYKYIIEPCIKKKIHHFSYSEGVKNYYEISVSTKDISTDSDAAKHAKKVLFITEENKFELEKLVRDTILKIMGNQINAGNVFIDIETMSAINTININIKILPYHDAVKELNKELTQNESMLDKCKRAMSLIFKG